MRRIALVFMLAIISAVSFAKKEVVNLYTERHYDADKVLIKNFEKETGIKVNVVKAKGDELIKKLKLEGKDTDADLFITADAGRLFRAKKAGLLQAVKTDKLDANVRKELKDADNFWYGLTYRARIIAYDPKRTDVSDLKRVEDLAKPNWKGKVVVRSSSNLYNQSLLASIIANDGSKKATEWAEGVVENMARTPKGNDRGQAKAVAAGIGEVAIMNSYYMGRMMTSKDPAEVEVAKALKIKFLNQEDRGSHINVSGAGVTKYAKNKENAIKFLEYMTSAEGQKVFAEMNFEYPVNTFVEPSEIVKSWGEFKIDSLDLNELGINNKEAVEIFDRSGWK